MVSKPTIGQRIAGAGGVILVVSLFLPWAGTDGSTRTGWELWTTPDVLFVFAGGLALVTAVAGGNIGFFRRDLSFAGATDLLGVVATTLIAWMLIVDFPAGASIEAGAVAGLLGAMTIAGGAADWSTLRGAPAFPRV